MVGTFNLPDVGEGLTEAEITSWKVSVGDVVEVNDVVVEIETAKSLVELPIPFAGEVRELLAEEGETLEVGSPLIRIAEAGSDSGPASGGGSESAPAPEVQKAPEAQKAQQTQSAGSGSSAEPSAAPAPSPESATTSTNTSTTTSAQAPESSADDGSGGDKALVGSGPKADAAKRRPRTRPAALDLVDAPGGAGQGRRDAVRDDQAQSRGMVDILARTTPPVRALARRLGVALGELAAAVPGPISRADVERLAQDHDAGSGAPGAPGAAGPVGGPDARGFTAGVLLREGPREEEIPVKGVRKHTALNVTQSAQEIPHVSVFRDTDITRTMELRAVLRDDSRYEGLSVSPLLFVAKAIIWAARRNPQVNATWQGDSYVMKNYVNLGIAAATPRGLVVPVIQDAQAYDTRGLAAAITELTATARAGKTSPAQMQGGTVSITNLGPLGLDGGTPILPPGQAAIIAVGAVRRKPWVVDEQIVPRDVMTVGGSFDHRLIDGEHAGHFVSDIARVLEQPGLLLD
ncbi:2-oxo acid dehydrogenase subunit E2 [Nesterenkonia aerolata]|uniref:Dihydrolipoamide acetyltransferase component of pyruvate dehydrogenase complex n=1 Tax=Nesterenkonia aerolata TaxID=3074079 RepID=A0ABU2DPM4_9MICC|nr:2-oxo acid dehydrogenase subunit E2 [Nesterenkonia sp. LY-0111]MDR8018404.1 2-oxo acid dehydrogenase subunit E2 [Nesterenkonia sp. LY-0111]